MFKELKLNDMKKLIFILILICMSCENDEEFTTYDHNKLEKYDLKEFNKLSIVEKESFLNVEKTKLSRDELPKFDNMNDALNHLYKLKYENKSKIENSKF
ncbi:hypothetical protein [Psychroflexus tropicus]|uniref:hypothetical protein n=1 Tax=Psychroflexus tropicus TaxID=197345 RepID=UPI00036AD4AF|nr:hypothetical protein [Psychroflexus tropicus]